MENKRFQIEEKGKKMGLPLEKPAEKKLGKGLIDYLCFELSINPTMLAGLLGITEKTLGMWRTRTVSELEENKKPLRLVTLYHFVWLARSFNVDKHLILSLMHDLVDPLNEKSGSILSHIVEEPDSSVLRAITPKLIRDFLEMKEFRKKAITLSDRDRDAFLAHLENPPEPNEALKTLFRKSTSTPKKGS